MKVEVTAPSSLDEITLEQYQEFMSLGEMTPEGFESTATTADVLRIFLGLNEDILNKIPYHEAERVQGILLSLFSEDHHHHGAFKLGNTEFGFIPNLDEISFGEHSDVSKYMSDWAEMHKAMAVLYRPITLRKKGKYLIEDYEGSAKYSEQLKKMPLSVVLGAHVFFYDLVKDLLSYIPNYLQEQVKGGHSLVNGVDTTYLIHLLKRTSDDLMQSLENPYTSVINFLPTKKTKQSMKPNA